MGFPWNLGFGDFDFSGGFDLSSWGQKRDIEEQCFPVPQAAASKATGLYRFYLPLKADLEANTRWPITFLRMTESNKSVDILGVKPVANAIEAVTKGAVDGAAAFLSRICLPAAEEFGLLLRDRVSAWRATHATAITNKAQAMVKAEGQSEPVQAHPRIVAGVIELGSWAESEEVQQMWAGLLASACTPEGRDDSNLMFVDLLSKLTVSQARLFDHVCQRATKWIVPAGWLMADELRMTVEELVKVTGIADVHRLDLEMDHLRALGLLNEMAGGFNAESTDADTTPSALALQMYARCQGYRGDPVSFYDAKPKPVEAPPPSNA